MWNAHTKKAARARPFARNMRRYTRIIFAMQAARPQEGRSGTQILHPGWLAQWIHFHMPVVYANLWIYPHWQKIEKIQVELSPGRKYMLHHWININTHQTKITHHANYRHIRVWVLFTLSPVQNIVSYLTRLVVTASSSGARSASVWVTGLPMQYGTNNEFIIISGNRDF